MRCRIADAPAPPSLLTHTGGFIWVVNYLVEEQHFFTYAELKAVTPNSLLKAMKAENKPVREQH